MLMLCQILRTCRWQCLMYWFLWCMYTMMLMMLMLCQDPQDVSVKQRLIYWFLCCIVYDDADDRWLCQILRTCRWTAFDLLVLVLYVYDDADDAELCQILRTCRLNRVWLLVSCVVCIRWCWCCVRSSGRVGEQRLIYWFLCCMYTMMLMMLMLCQILRTCRWTAFDLLVLVLYVYDDADDADVVSDPQDVSVNSVWFTGSCGVCKRWCWWCWCCVRSSGRVGEQCLIYWFLCCMYTMMLMLCQILRTCRWTAFDLLVLVLYVYDDADDADVVSDPQDVSVNSVWFTGSCVVCIRWCWCCVRSSGRVGEQCLIYWFLCCM